LVLFDGNELGTVPIIRGDGKLQGSVNSDQSWLVVDDGVEADSPPHVQVFRVSATGLSASKDFQAFSKAFSDDWEEGSFLPMPGEPMFLGFDSDGFPLVAFGSVVRPLKR
jgi:hypothetical protein